MPLDDKDKYKMITDREAELQPLYSRQDTDKDLYWLKPYSMMDSDNRPIPHVENVTLNDPKTFGDRAIAILTAIERQTIVKSESLNDDQKATVKNFLDDIDLVIDEKLQSTGQGANLDSIILSQLAIRGYTADRIDIRMEDGKFVADATPWDARFSASDYDRHGLLWASYRSSRSKWLVQEEYGIQRTESPVEIIDLYERNKLNTTFIGGPSGEVRTRSHGFDFVPVIIEKTATGAFMRDSDYIKHDGESIFAGARELFDKKNQQMSIMQTLTVASFFAGLQYAGPEGADMKKKPQLPPYGLRFVVPIDKEAGYKSMPINDIHNATRLGFTILETAIQKATFPPTEFGSLEFPMSAVGLVELGQGRDQVVLPILQGWALSRRKLALMIIKQFIEKNMTATLGRPGSTRRTYTASDLAGDFEIVYKFKNISAKDKIANITMAQAIGRDLSEDTKLREIYQVENPTLEQAKKMSESARQLIPELMLYDMAKAKLQLDPPDEVGAQIIAEKLGVSLEQIETGNLEGIAAPVVEGTPKQIVPLTGGPTTASRKSSLERRGEIASEVTGE